MNYFTIPIQLKYNFSPVLHVLAGPQYHFLMEKENDADLIVDGLRKKHLSFGFGVGMDLPMGFGASLKFNHAINEAYKDLGGASHDLVQLSFTMDLLELR